MSIDINPNWSRLTLQQYLDYVKFYNEHQKENNLNLRLLAHLTGDSYDSLMNCPLTILNSKMDSWAFLAEDFTEYSVESPSLNIGDQIYFINKNFGLLSLQQTNDIDVLLTNSNELGNKLFLIHEMMSIAALPASEYNYDKAQEMGQAILNLPMDEIIPNIIFFLNNESSSSVDILSSLKESQKSAMLELDLTMNRLRHSTKSGAGMPRRYRWRMKIILMLVGFYLRLRRKFFNS